MTSKIILVAIIVLSILLRFVNLGSFPVGFSQDESQQAYSAYSILKTGKDEWGDFLPLNPRSLGDYKPPLQMYLLIPSIAVFGLNEFAVRLPSAIFGVIAIVCAYYLVKKLWNDEKLALICAFLFSLMPWAIQYSRVGWEGNISVTLFLFSLLLLFKGLEKSKYFLLSGVVFGINLYSYHSVRVITVLTILIFVAFYFKHLKKIKNSAILGFGIIVLLSLPIIFSGSALKRAGDVTFFLSEDSRSEYRSINQTQTYSAKLGFVFNNPVTFYSDRLIQNYLKYFSFDFLFTSDRSDGSYLNLPGFPIFYIWTFPILLWGIFRGIIKKDKAALFLMCLCLAAPIPAAITKGAPSLFRAVFLLPFVTILIGYGFVDLWKLFKESRIVLGGFVGLLLISLGFFLNFYFMHMPHKNLGDLQYGFKEVINYAENKGTSNIVFSRNYSNPQAFIAFYTKIDPTEYQKYSKDFVHFESDGLRYVDQLGEYKVGKYIIRDLSWAEDRKRKDTLIIAPQLNFPNSVVTGLVITHPGGKTIFYVVDPSAGENSNLNI